MFRPAAAFVIAACVVVSPACEISVVKLEMSDAAGIVTPWNYSAPNIGVKVTWNVVGTPNAPYSVKFAFADAQPITFDNFNTGAGTFAATCITSYPSLFAIPVTVTVDPNNVAGNTTPTVATMMRRFTVAPPTTALVKYGTQSLFGKQSMTVPVASGSPAKLVMLLGKPTTDTFQSVVSDTSDGTAVVTQPTGYPGWQKVLTNVAPGSYSLSQSFKITASNVACNLGLLNATWAQFDSVHTALANYLGTEPNVETTDPMIVAFVNNTLPANYRTTITPLEAAEKLFAAVVRRTTYQTPFTGDASKVFRLTHGDCGGMTNLYNACLRIVGIPCRSTCGWWTDGTTHCWSEIYFPKVGWIPADTSLSRRFSAACKYMPYFAYAPSSNQRCAVSRASTMNTADISTGQVQVGALAWFAGPGVTPVVGPMSFMVALSKNAIP